MKRKRKAPLQRIVLWRGPSYLDGTPVVAVATIKTRNRKIGNMVQVWILPDLEATPLQALQQGKNSGACGDCPLQGRSEKLPNGKTKLVGRVCYVNVGQGPNAIHRALKAGNYAGYDPAKHDKFFVGARVRLGAYGDPMAIPVGLCEHLVGRSRKHTGYTHQLFRLGLDPSIAQRFANILMVSAHNKAIDGEAKRRGWRRFTIVQKHEDAPEGSLHCPAYEIGITCAQCGLCNGAQSGAKSIYAVAHSMSGTNLHLHQL